MAALTNGAAVQIWNQKPSLWVVVVFQIGEAQKGKSHLFQILENIFNACDDVVADHVRALLCNRIRRRSRLAVNVTNNTAAGDGEEEHAAKLYLARVFLPVLTFPSTSGVSSGRGRQS